MHNEDNRVGLVVRNPAGKTWTAFGDKKLFSNDSKENLNQCLAALKASADEVLMAWKTGKVIASTQFQAWQHDPTLESARGPQHFKALFSASGDVRKNLRNTTQDSGYETPFSWATCLANLKLHGL